MVRKRGGLGVSYEVKLDAARGRWNVTRGGVRTPSFARDKHTALGQARLAAQQEADTTDLKVTLWLVEGDKRTKEWESP